MDVLTGVLVDVSGSMEESVGDREVEGTASSWAKSIFKFIDRLIKHDATRNHRGFAIGFGSCKQVTTFDVLTTLKELNVAKTLQCRGKRNMLREIVSIIEANGAPRFSEFVTIDEMHEHIDEYQTAVLLNVLKNKPGFKCEFIYRILPAYCREVQATLRMVKEAMDIMENDGAPRVRKWATEEEICKVIDIRTAAVLLDALKKHPQFRQEFIYNCLPDSCRKVPSPNRYAVFGGIALSFIFAPAGLAVLGGTAAACYRKEIAIATVGQIPAGHEAMTKDSIKDVIKKGMDLVQKLEIKDIMVKDLMKQVIDLVEDYILAKVDLLTGQAVYCAKEASDILHGCVGEQELTDERTKELLERVKPFIYGGTPLMKSLHQAVSLFRDNRDSQYKLLFILSDGQPADGRDPPLSELSDLGVKVVCCYITRRSIKEPRRLYSSMQQEWDGDAKFMFNMSSTITTQKIPRTMFVKKGWKIDIDRNETRMFFQINHPDIIDEVCDLARECVCSQDSLADVLSSVDLDIYINKAIEGLSPDQQKDKEKTCYAIASATVIHMALKRIVGREGGCPKYITIRDELIRIHKVKGAKVKKVLREACPIYRLQCKKTDELGALNAVAEKRPVVAIFQLSDDEHKSFCDFYKDNRRGVLTKNQVNVDVRPEGAKLRVLGHAVVLTSFNSECLRLMNSKGSRFADGGFFRVENAAVLGMEFYDVFWTEEDLLPSEKEAYRRDGADQSAKLMSSLTSLQTATYKCPLCSVESNVSEFTGHLLAAVCPRCQYTFDATKADTGDLALNLYLTSL